MVRPPSRRDVLCGSAGALAGVTGGLFARPHLGTAADSTADESADPVPLAWADAEWPYPDYDPARTRHPPASSAPDDALERDWRVALDPVHSRTPVVAANGRVFTGAVHDRGTTVRAVSLGTGAPAWERHYDGDDTTRPSLVAAGDGVYYRISDGRFPLGQLGAATGERVWGVADPPLGGWTLGGGRLYYGDRKIGALRAYDARTGESLWSTGVDDERLVVRSFHPEYGVFAASFGTLYALDPADGAVRWTVPVPEHTRSGPVVTGGRAFVTKWGDGMDLLAFDAATGDRLWRYPLSPTEVERSGRVFRRWYELGAATPETVLIVERHADEAPGALHAVDAATGDRLWRVAPPDGARAFSAPTVVDGDAYVCVGGDDLTALLRLDPADGTRRASRPLPDHGSAPVVTDGRVLVRTGRELLAFA